MSLGTIILFQVHRERGRGHGGHLSLGKMILSVEPGRRGGSFASRNNSSNCRTRGGGGGGGGGGSFVLSLFKCRTRDTGSFVSRNNDSKCRTSHLSLGITILSVESER